jgi:hypothetical protein
MYLHGVNKDNLINRHFCNACNVIGHRPQSDSGTVSKLRNYTMNLVYMNDKV